ncbi:MAG: hydroxyacid dehydrogenase [Chloroflexi bacterium]|nr:MAG: hydroxyacid dehydrogenase [Chloroflexota bacterium]
MAAWKILLTDGLEENGRAILREAGEVEDRTGISAEDLMKIVGEYDALIVRGRTKVTPAVFDAGTNLKVVGRAGVGVDNIDLNAARQHQVTVVNSPLATTVAVAELAIGLMLTMLRDIPRANAAMKEGKWLKKELEGAELYQSTLGIVGYGRIGQAVGKRAAAFDMRVVAFDPLRPTEEICQDDCTPLSLDEVLAQSDIISVHTPLSSQTKGMLGAEQFAKMKDGVYLVDTARGGVVDETALLEALNSGKVAGVGLDVFATEPPGQAALVCHPKVVGTPHIGAQTIQAQQRAAYDISTEIVRALRGEELRWRVA